MKPKKLKKRQKQKLLDKLAGQAMAALIVRNGGNTDMTPVAAHIYAMEMLICRERIRKKGRP